MKKNIIKLAAVAALGCAFSLNTGASAEAKDVKVTLPAFNVTLNGVTVDQTHNKYPLLVYNDITYVPMTYYDARLLGLSTAWDNKDGLEVAPLSFIPDAHTAQSQYKSYTTDQTNQKSYTASTAQFKIKVAGQVIDNSKEEYPLLVFRDVTYFPLTWRYAVTTFGWQYNFNMTDGLKITPVPSKVFDSYQGVITGSVVNVRADATTESAALTQLSKGTHLTVTNEKKAANGDLWYAVTLSNGTKGYVASWLLTDAASYEKNKQTNNNNNNSNNNSTTPSTEISTVSLASMTSGSQETDIVLNVGKSAVSTVQNSAHAVTLTMANANSTADLNLQPEQGPLVSSKSEIKDNQLIWTLNLADGAYATVNKNDSTLTVRVRQRDAAATGLAGKTIVIDPGHGSYKNGTVDPGAIGRVLGYTDREVGTDIGFKLKDALEARGATVIMTRGKAAVNMNLYDRANIANNNNADLFISIHGNALESNFTKSGIEVYYYGGSGTLTSGAQKYIRQELAKHVSGALATATGRSSTVKTDNFVVIREPDCPSILVEAGYLSNQEEEALLATDAYQTIMANGICQGVVDYFTAK